jgi:hypothetical protein
MAVEFHSEPRRGGCPDDREYFGSAIWREASGRRRLRDWGRFAVAQRHSAIPCTRRAEIESRTVSDFYIGVLSVLAIVLSVAIGMAATVALGKNPLGPDHVVTNTAGAPGSVDDYVEGLARLGIVKIGCFRHAQQSAHPPTCSHDGGTRNVLTPTRIRTR